MDYCIILAAGFGSRLGDFTKNDPKTLYNIYNRPILAYIINNLESAGLEQKNIFVCIGYQHQNIIDYLDENYPLVQTYYNDQHQSTNNMISCYYALKNLLTTRTIFPEDRLLICNGDGIHEKTIIASLVQKSAPCFALKHSYDPEGMKAQLNAQGHLLNLSKDFSPESSQGLALDLYLLNYPGMHRLIEIIEESFIQTAHLNEWIEQALIILGSYEPIQAHYFEKPFTEIDNLNDVLYALHCWSSLDLDTKQIYFLCLDDCVFKEKQLVMDNANFIKTLLALGKTVYFMLNEAYKAAFYHQLLEKYKIHCSVEQIIRKDQWESYAQNFPLKNCLYIGNNLNDDPRHTDRLPMDFLWVLPNIHHLNDIQKTRSPALIVENLDSLLES